MSTKYPANIYSAIVAELFGAFYPSFTALIPSSKQLEDAAATGKNPYQAVNDCMNDAGVNGEKKLLTELDELRVIRELIAHGYLSESRQSDVISHRNNLSREELERIDNWKQQAYPESRKSFCVTYEAVNISGEVISCKANVSAISELDAVMLFGSENADENYFVKEVKEV